MKKISFLLTLLLIFAVIVSGCTQNTTHVVSNGDNGDNTQTSPTEVNKDSLTIVIPTDVSKFSPYYTMTHADIYLVYQIYERLVYYKDGEVVSGLASDWEVSEDKKTILFNLRKDTYFHNGDKLTADDVVYSFNSNFERPSAKSTKEKFASIEAINDDQVKIELIYPMESVYSVLSSPGMSIINKAYVESNGDEAYMTPVGTGAYKLKNWSRGSRVELEAFDKYNGGEVPIKYLNFEVIPDQNTAVVALETGKVDMIINASASNIGLLQNNPSVDISYGPSHTSAKLYMNVRNGVTMDKNLRQAIAYAIDREAINLVAYEDRGQISKGMFDDFLFYSGKDFTYEYDPEKAKELISSTPYANGLTLTLKTSEYYGTTVPQLIQQNLSDIGIQLKIESLEMNAHSQDYLSGNFELLYTANSSIVPDVGEALYSIYHAPENATYFHAPEEPVFNQDLDSARAETDIIKKTKIYDKILLDVKDLAGALELVNGESNLIYTKWLKGIYIDPNGMFYCFKDFSW